MPPTAITSTEAHPDRRFLVQLVVLDTMEEDELDVPRVIHNTSYQVSSPETQRGEDIDQIAFEIESLIENYLKKLGEE